MAELSRILEYSKRSGPIVSCIQTSTATRIELLEPPLSYWMRERSRSLGGVVNLISMGAIAVVPFYYLVRFSISGDILFALSFGMLMSLGAAYMIFPATNYLRTNESIFTNSASVIRSMQHGWRRWRHPHDNGRAVAGFELEADQVRMCISMHYDLEDEILECDRSNVLRAEVRERDQDYKTDRLCIVMKRGPFDGDICLVERKFINRSELEAMAASINDALRLGL